MHTSPYCTYPSHLLEQLVRDAESRLIAGKASEHDIDAYVEGQLELADRNDLDFVLDVRD